MHKRRYLPSYILLFSLFVDKISIIEGVAVTRVIGFKSSVVPTVPLENNSLIWSRGVNQTSLGVYQWQADL